MNGHNPSSPQWAEAEGLLRRASRILAITHLNPDGDAIGSLLGFTLAMRSLGKTVQPACQDTPQARFRYLRGVNDIWQKVDGAFDLVVGIDASDIYRLGDVYQPAVHSALPMIVFDHHITNTYYGVANVVEPEKASSAEIILQLLRRMNIPLTSDIAAALMTGLITDTLCFRTSNTTPDTMAAAMELMRAGASLVEITRQALVLRPFSEIVFLGAGITEAKLENGIAYANISRKMRKQYGQDDRGDAGLVGQLISVEEAKIAVVFSEDNDGSIKVSMRSAPGYDVSRVAFEFGGGGHPAAAGCTLSGPMRDATSRILRRLQQVVQRSD